MRWGRIRLSQCWHIVTLRLWHRCPVDQRYSHCGAGAGSHGAAVARALLEADMATMRFGVDGRVCGYSERANMLRSYAIVWSISIYIYICIRYKHIYTHTPYTSDRISSTSYTTEVYGAHVFELRPLRGGRPTHMYDIHVPFNAYTSTVHHCVSTDMYPSLMYVQYAMGVCGYVAYVHGCDMVVAHLQLPDEDAPPVSGGLPPSSSRGRSPVICVVYTNT